jgi:hypothetical protein
MSRKDESDNKMASSDDKRTLNHTKWMIKMIVI